MEKIVKGVKRGPYTNAEIFEAVNKRLKAAGLIPAIIDYGNPDYHDQKITSYEWDVIGKINFGSEGLYLDIYAEGVLAAGEKASHVRLGVYKTLESTRDAYKKMGELLADFVFECRDFINENIDAFTWTGYDVKFYGEAGEYLWGYSECPTIEAAEERRDKTLAREGTKARRAVIIDNETGEIVNV